VNDDSRGDWVYWSNAQPQPAEYGPALVVSSDDLATAQANVTAYYADPGIVDDPLPPRVMITASYSQAAKGTGVMERSPSLARVGITRNLWMSPFPSLAARSRVPTIRF